MKLCIQKGSTGGDKLLLSNVLGTS